MYAVKVCLHKEQWIPEDLLHYRFKQSCWYFSVLPSHSITRISCVTWHTYIIIVLYIFTICIKLFREMTHLILRNFTNFTSCFTRFLCLCLARCQPAPPIVSHVNWTAHILTVIYSVATWPGERHGYAGSRLEASGIPSWCNITLWKLAC